MHFIKYQKNPILLPQQESVFHCPLGGVVHWEEKDVFNPSAVVKDGKVYLLYRAEDKAGKHAGTSRIGLALSEDGFTFLRWPEPVLYPQEDAFQNDEWDGGCEDPRVVEAPDGGYVMLYTAFNGKKVELFSATSPDLLSWTKHGYAFDESLPDFRSKSGAVICEEKDGHLVAAKINKKYWMYWGEGVIYAAVSDDLIRWTPVFNSEERKSESKKSSLSHRKWSGDERLYAVLDGRKGQFDAWLTEPGPCAVRTPYGIVLLYNGAVRNLLRKPSPEYCAGRALFDCDDPLRLIQRDDEAFLKPDQPFEVEGQVGSVCFAQGLVKFREQWLLYYGTADSKIAVAVSESLV